ADRADVLALARDVGCADLLDELRFEVRTGRASDGDHLEPAHAKDERGELTDRPRAHHRCPARLPHFEPPLNLPRLREALLDDAHGLHEDAECRALSRTSASS